MKKESDNPASGKGVEAAEKVLTSHGEDNPAVAACKAFFEKHFSQLVGHFFDQVDDELFKLSNRAESSVLQQNYFDTMRMVRREREDAQNNYLNSLLRGYSEFWQKGAQPSAKKNGRTSDAGGFDKENLSLVDNIALEEGLAVSGMIEKGNGLYDDHLYALNKRFAFLLGKEDLALEENPLSPEIICLAFEQAIKSTDMDPRIKLIIFKLYDRVVLSGLGDLYNGLNAVLAEHSILLSIPKRPRHAPVPSSAASTALHTGQVDAKQGAESATAYGDVFQMMHSMMGEWRSQAGVPSTKSMFSGPAFQTSEVLNTLSTLQVPDGESSELADQALKTFLSNELNKQQPEGESRPMGEIDEDIIDMVSMAFDFILDENTLSSKVRSVIARLQIPVIKVAIIEKNFFAKQSHPARQLLNRLAQAGLTISDEGCESNPTYRKIEEVVRRILDEFEQNVELFTVLLDDFSAFVDKELQRSTVMEERTIRTTSSKEQRFLAQKEVASQIARRVHGQTLPVVVTGMLEDAWKDVMFLSLLRKDQEPEEWANVLEVMDKLLWSVEPHTDSGERKEILTEIAFVVKGLRKGLETISYDPFKIDTLFEQLEKCHSAALNSAAASAPAAGEPSSLEGVEPIVPDEVERVVIDSSQFKDPLLAAEIEAITATLAGADHSMGEGNFEGEEEIFSEEIVLESADLRELRNEVEDEQLTMAVDMKIGQWLEMVDERGKRVRAKLSWRSSVTGLMVFVNRKGVKVAEKTAQGLAAELRRESTFLISGEKAPLMDRALSAVMNMLKSSSREEK